jgi:hypothetical protein
MEASSNEIAPPIVRVILYVRDIPKVAAFYQRHFGLIPQPGATSGWLELANPSGSSKPEEWSRHKARLLRR